MLTFDNNFNNSVDLQTYARKPGTVNVYEQVTEGSPWLRTYWCRADMMDGNGRTFRDIAIKIDLVADKLYYLDKGQEMELITPVMYLFALDSLTRDTLKMVRGDFFKLPENNLNGWMQLYAEGEAILLQDMDKKLHENKAYNSAVTDYHVLENYSWVILLDKKAYRIKKIKEAETLLTAKKPGLKTGKYAGKGLGQQLRELVEAYNLL